MRRSGDTVRGPRSLPWLAAAALLTLLAAAVAADPGELLSYRHRAMCAHVAAGRADLIGSWLDPAKVGQMPYDAAYGKWLHSLGRAKDSIGVFRQERLYEALKAMAAMEGKLSAAEPMSEREVTMIREWLAGGDSLATLAGKPGANLARIRAALLALEPVTRDVLVLGKPVPEAQTASEDLAYLVTLPLVSSERARWMVAEVEQCSEDKDLSAACATLLEELETGRQDYVKKLLVTLADGEKVGWLRRKLASTAATKLVVGPLLQALGLSVAGGPAGIVATLLLGYDVAMAATGEHQAYPHARLAHFADMLKPGLHDRWLKLREGLSSDKPDLCDQFDQTTQAAILLTALVNDEARQMQQAYEKAPVPIGDAVPMQLTDTEVVQRVYRDWMSGTAFAAQAPSLGEGSATQPPATGDIPSLQDTWNLRR